MSGASKVSFKDLVKPAPLPETPQAPASPSPVPAVRDAAPPATRMDDPPVAVRRLARDPRSAVLEAGWSAKDAPGTWRQVGWRAPKDLHNRLMARLAHDKLTRPECHRAEANHYLSYALSTLPDDPAAAAQLGMTWRQAHRGPTHMNNGSGKLVEGHVADKWTIITTTLAAMPDTTVKAWEIAAAALEAVLDQLDKADEAAG